MAYYDTIYTGGDSSGSEWMSVYLYPHTDSSGSDEMVACKSEGSVATALRHAGNELLSWEAIDYYEVLRFRVEDYKPPDTVDPTNGNETVNDFKEYLDDNGTSPDNGTGENLYSQIGVHQLIHSNQNACDEDSEGYAPAGANAEGSDPEVTAFTTGLVAWSPVCSNSTGLTRNAAIQEALHQFIGKAYDDGWTGTEDDQHSLGTVREPNQIGYVTPLLTYHWDDDIGDGSCPPDKWTASGYDQELTSCTKSAVKESADQDLGGIGT